ncbi:AAA family ATPase [Lignipirellula cremea]|uniref:ATPase RavA n=1 Tax=Lignipirellula cremea TaxID=2528010 RepID=A0A518DWD6_9BACT|nr:MoxR family ATPase [Lignipirellula cremea]QDU96144.1 ATPase RavA [Lignipirellula cremea]
MNDHDSGFVLPPDEPWSDAELEKIGHLKEAHDKISGQIRKAVVGQDKVVNLTLISLFSRGHCLLKGVPGLGKTLLVQSIASSLSLKFRRVQFTPDLMPSDITGAEVIQEDKTTGERQFRFIEGPIFTNMLLADEINRTPPKTQAALLEAMQEKQVTVGGERRQLAEPFFVMATQNPVEQEGTYPLPEAQMDRFMFQINVGYPTIDEERLILAMTTASYKPDIQPVLEQQEIVALQNLVRRVKAPEPVIDFILRLVRATRASEPESPDFIKRWINWGASPRACQNLVVGGKAAAILDGRNEVTMEDVIQVAHAVLGHRILPNFAAEAERITTDQIVDDLLKAVA